MSHAEFLRALKRGQTPKVGDWNALARRAGRVVDLGVGHAGEDHLAFRAAGSAEPLWADVVNVSDEEVPAFSIFSGHVDQPYADNAKLRIEKIGARPNRGSPFIFLTNEDVPIAANGGTGVARVVAMWDSVIAICDDDCLPSPGQPCGPLLGSYKLTKNMGGFVCLTQPLPEDPAIPGLSAIRVLRTREPIGVVGRVIEEITPYSKKGRGEFGKGRIQVLYRTPKIRCVDEPQQPWEDVDAGFTIEVYNFQDVSFGVDERVACSDALGIGLIVETGTVTSPTTTTPAPNDTGETSLCSGQCKKVWSVSTMTWSTDSSTCAGTTTTTTPGPTTTTVCPCPETTTTSEPTTTTTSGPTTTTTSGPTTTTTTLGPEGCKCLEPTYCGTFDGECTFTWCTTREANDPVDCQPTTTTQSPTTTTTCDCNTTTTTVTPTTTTSGPCTGGCDWVGMPSGGGWVWVKSRDLCASECPCGPPTTEAEDCAQAHTNCVRPPPGPPPTPPSCNGDCTYWYFPSTGNWHLYKGDCAGSGTVCLCTPPSIPGNRCAPVTVPCSAQSPTTTTTTSQPTTTQHPCWKCYTTTTTTSGPTTTTTSAPTTTTTPSPCATGKCYWRWGTSWAQLSSSCPSECPCSYPVFDGQESCQTTETFCQPTTTTTQAPTTTTTQAPTTTTTQAPTTTTTSGPTTTTTTDGPTTTTTTEPPLTTPPPTTTTTTGGTTTTCAPPGQCHFQCDSVPPGQCPNVQYTFWRRYGAIDCCQGFTCQSPSTPCTCANQGEQVSVDCA